MSDLIERLEAWRDMLKHSGRHADVAYADAAIEALKAREEPRLPEGYKIVDICGGAMGIKHGSNIIYEAKSGHERRFLSAFLPTQQHDAKVCDRSWVGDGRHTPFCRWCKAEYHDSPATPSDHPEEQPMKSSNQAGRHRVTGWWGPLRSWTDENAVAKVTREELETWLRRISGIDA